jgi:hypothetical protein
MIAVLFSPARINPGRLQMRVFARADSDVSPRRRNHQLPNPSQSLGICYALPMRVQVLEALAERHSSQARPF